MQQLYNVMIDFDIRDVPSMRWREGALRKRLRASGLSNVCFTEDVMVGKSHQERIGNWLRQVGGEDNLPLDQLRRRHADRLRYPRLAARLSCAPRECLAAYRVREAAAAAQGYGAQTVACHAERVMNRLRDVEQELLKIFRSSASKHEANTRARPLMEQLTREPAFLSAVIAKYLATPGVLDKQNYPVVGMEIALNPWFGLVANCWIPLPGRETNISTKAIHHHGTMLLTTATLYGPGYEHWMFTMPKRVSEGSEVFAMDLLESAPHPAHHVSFVDKWTAHLPLYPSSLSITLALWSNSAPTTWQDRVKRLPIFKGREKKLRQLAVRLGLKRGLALKVVESFDFYPAADGFRVIPERSEFALGPNDEHLCSVFHVIQQTGNEHLARDVRRALDAGKVTTGRPTVERLVKELERGTPIEGRLSSTHYGVPTMNFTREEVERALAALKARADAKTRTNQGDSDGRKFTAPTNGQARIGAPSR